MPTTTVNSNGFYILLTGFAPSSSAINLSLTVSIEYIPTAAYASMAPTDYAPIGPATD